MRNTSLLLYQTEQIKELERLAIAKQNLSIAVLMQRAGKAAWLALRENWPNARHIIVLCGKGNNAGDGYTLARLIHEAGIEVSIANVVEIDKLQGAAKEAALACQESEIKITPTVSENFANLLCNADVVVDALLGTGLAGAVNDDFARVIAEANASGKPILALDIPSGLEANTGNVVHMAIRATTTITFIGRKCGLYTGYAREFCGKIICDDLEVEPKIFAMVNPLAKILDLQELLKKFPKRSPLAHKGKFGHVLVVGGNLGMGGAAKMAAEATVRVGAGLVSVATRKEHIVELNEERPELMCYGIDAGEQLQPLLAKATVVVLGPGLGQDEWAKMLFDEVLDCALPLVVDADALNLIAKYYENNPGHFNRNNWVLTPHPGEAARLTLQTTTSIQADRFAALKALQKKFGGICVLKGAGTLVSNDPKDDCIGICTAGNPGMASGGMGDVLSGIIGGLIAQHMEPIYAAQFAVCLHSCAADMAAQEGGEVGLLATDLLPYVRRLLML